MKYNKILILILLSLFSYQSYAQVSLGEFGKNRIQYKTFRWQYYSSDNFDVYFYQEGQNIAKMAAEYLEKEFERITDIIGYAPYSKTKIFIFNSVSDLQQSNVNLNKNNFTIGGQTNFVKSQVEIAYPGTMHEFKQELILKISNMLVNDMMYGGTLTDMFQSAHLLRLPDWFINGAARYIAYGWNVEMDDYIRDVIHHDNVKKFTKLSGRKAAMVGQSVWNFIAVHYGRNNISNILNLTRIIRNEDNSISNTLGIPFKRFFASWQNYYTSMATVVKNDYKFPPEDQRLRHKNRRGYQYKNVKISPNGQYIAYSENYKGKYKVYVENIKTGKDNKVHTGGYRVINQEIDEDLPLLSWQDSNNLGIVGVKKGENYIWIHNINSGQKQARPLVKFNQIKGFDFHPAGNELIISGDINGKNDLFTYNLFRNSIHRITNDYFDDLHPRFLPETNAIVFSSNRTRDSINQVNNQNSDFQLKDNINDNFNIFYYHLDTSQNKASRITNTLSRDIKPIPKNDETIYYLSDQRGIFNVYEYNLRDSLFNQISNYGVSIEDFDIDFESNTLAYLMLSNEDYYVHLNPDFDLENNIFTPKTKRQEVIQSQFVKNRIERYKTTQNNEDTLEKKPSGELKQLEDQPQSTPEGRPKGKIEVKDSTGLINVDSLNIAGQDTIPQDTAKTAETPTDIIDTDNYQFEQEVVREEEKSNSFLARYRKLSKETEIIGPLGYKPQFMADNVITSWVIDPLMGFGINLEIQMNDMLENHKFYGGLLAITDLKSGNLFAEYQYLKQRIDFHARYERESIHKQTESVREVQKYIRNRFEVGASYPLNVAARFTVSPFLTTTRYIDMDPSLLNYQNPYTKPFDVLEGYGGIQAEFVFDNTLINGLNLYEGTRGKISFSHYEGIKDKQNSFSNINVDVRHYQKIHREFTFASKFFYGSYFGNNQQTYMLGGMDNWLFSDTNPSEGRNKPLHFERLQNNSDVLFLEYVTNLRGFNYNYFNGSSAMLANFELRLPIIKYLYRGPISSNFFRNLQFIGFYDIGSAWSGISPFKEENSVNTEIIKRGPFEAEVKTFKNPWLSSYGFGARTSLLGYYVKFDVAYPIEDYEVGTTKYYLTLGYDF